MIGEELEAPGNRISIGGYGSGHHAVGTPGRAIEDKTGAPALRKGVIQVQGKKLTVTLVEDEILATT